jgi:protein-tyrosine phosphatase
MSSNPTILTVCTGNLCRSPVLERLLAFGIARHWPAAASGSTGLRLASAGTRALVGQSIPDPLLLRLAAAGADSSPYAARQLTRELIADAGLVIVATRAHRAAVAELHPPAVRRTFTLRELARLTVDLPPGDRAPLDPAARLGAFVAALAASRGLAALVDPADDDVIDPYLGSDARYEEAWEQLRSGAAAMLKALVPAPQIRRPQFEESPAHSSARTA